MRVNTAAIIEKSQRVTMKAFFQGLPGCPWCPTAVIQILYGLGDELIVGPDVARHAAWDEEGLSDAGMRSNVMLKSFTSGRKVIFERLPALATDLVRSRQYSGWSSPSRADHRASRLRDGLEGIVSKRIES